MPAIAKLKQIYGYKGHPSAEFVKFGQYAHQVYRFFASKRNADNGLVWLERAFGKKQVAPSRAVKTTKGWAVVQLPRRGHRIESTDPNLYKVGGSS